MIDFKTWRFTWVKSKFFESFAAFGATKKILFSESVSVEVEPAKEISF
jgi:hypothetical protein